MLLINPCLPEATLGLGSEKRCGWQWHLALFQCHCFHTQIPEYKVKEALVQYLAFFSVNERMKGREWIEKPYLKTKLPLRKVDVSCSAHIWVWLCRGWLKQDRSPPCSHLNKVQRKADNSWSRGSTITREPAFFKIPIQRPQCIHCMVLGLLSPSISAAFSPNRMEKAMCASVKIFPRDSSKHLQVHLLGQN